MGPHPPRTQTSTHPTPTVTTMTRTYTAAEKATYKPDPCPHCEHTLITNWLDVHTSQDPPGDAWVIGSYTCPNPHCFTNQPRRHTTGQNHQPLP